MALTDKLRAIGAALRGADGGSQEYSLPQMAQRPPAWQSSIAEAITAKGVDTMPDSTFDVMAANIGLISGGGGMPEGVTEINCGTYIPTENESTWFGKKIAHGLKGAAKYVVMTDMDFVLQSSYTQQSAVCAFGIVTNELRAGISMTKTTAGATNNTGYIEPLTGNDVGRYSGIRPDESQTEFKVAFYSGFLMTANHRFFWIAAR